MCFYACRNATVSMVRVHRVNRHVFTVVRSVHCSFTALWKSDRPFRVNKTFSHPVPDVINQKLKGIGCSCLCLFSISGFFLLLCFMTFLEEQSGRTGHHLPLKGTGHGSVLPIAVNYLKMLTWQQLLSCHFATILKFAHWSLVCHRNRKFHTCRNNGSHPQDMKLVKVKKANKSCGKFGEGIGKKSLLLSLPQA